VDGTYSVSASPEISSLSSSSSSSSSITIPTSANAGQYTITVAFAPTNQYYATPAPVSFPLTILKATPSLTYASESNKEAGSSYELSPSSSPSGIEGTYSLYNSPHTASISNESASKGKVTFKNTNPAGSYTTTVIFTPSDTTNYNTVTTTFTTTFVKKTPTVKNLSTSIQVKRSTNTGIGTINLLDALPTDRLDNGSFTLTSTTVETELSSKGIVNGSSLQVVLNQNAHVGTAITVPVK
jgi:hypothetical protein